MRRSLRWENRRDCITNRGPSSLELKTSLLAPKIPGVIEDAKAVAEVFRKLGFEEVVELYDKDASSRRLQQTLVDFLPRKVGRQDRLVIYFSGHAGITQSGTGKDLVISYPGTRSPGMSRRP